MVSRNRLHNANNEAQGAFTRVLCVCSAGLLRSPTLAWVLSQDPYNFNTRAVGMVDDYALVPIDEVHVAWADKIVFAEMSHFMHFKALFPETPNVDKIVLALPDIYEYRDPKLVQLAREQLATHFF